jgi:hypothetical protein
MKKNVEDREILRRLFDGNLLSPFFCAKTNGEYSLYKRVCRSLREVREPAGVTIIGKRVNSDNSYQNNPEVTFNKGAFTQLRLSSFNEVPVFSTGAKVLCLKPTTGSEFTKTFFPARIVFGPTQCERKYRETSLIGGDVNIKRKRHQYKVKFDDKEKSVCDVFEELIIPTEEHWGNEKLKYEGSSESTTESSSEESETSSGSESESESSEDEKEDTKRKKEKIRSKRRKTSHKKTKHRYKRNKYSSNVLFEGTAPSIVVIPVIIPYNPGFSHFQYPLQYPHPFFR